jgi:hypothetical protein
MSSPAPADDADDADAEDALGAGLEHELGQALVGGERGVATGGGPRKATVSTSMPRRWASLSLRPVR